MSAGSPAPAPSPLPPPLAGQAGLVVGASGTIGRALLRVLARAGARVAGHAHQHVDAVDAEARAFVPSSPGRKSGRSVDRRANLGGPIRSLRADLTRPGAGRRLMARALCAMDVPRFDFILYAADNYPDGPWPSSATDARTASMRRQWTALALDAPTALLDAMAEGWRHRTTPSPSYPATETDVAAMPSPSLPLSGKGRGKGEGLRRASAPASRFPDAQGGGGDAGVGGKGCSSEAGAFVFLLDARMDEGIPGREAYWLGKRMQAALMDDAARRHAPSLRVNAVAPGAVDWPGHEAPPDERARRMEAARRAAPLGRCPTAEEVAMAALFLIASPSVTGQTLYVDGGRHLGRRAPSP